jgi:hypothetical protein
MSNIFITSIVGTGTYAIPTNDAELAAATAGFDTLLGGVANLTYDRVLQVDVVVVLWSRDAAGFLYPNTATDDIVVGGNAAPNGKWFDDGDLVLGAASMSGTEKLRVVGASRIEGLIEETTGVRLAEQAADPGSTGAGYGTFWIKDDAPTTPYFTDDTAVDRLLMYSGADSPMSVLSEPTGFPNRTDTTLSFDDLSLTFTIAPTGASFDYWIQGIKYTVGSKSATITNTEGLWIFYLDSSEVLNATQTFTQSILESGAICAIIYWDVSAAAHILLAEERHGAIMDGTTHWYLHTVFGTQWISGGALGNFSVDQSGDVNAHAQFDCATVTIADEDIVLTTSDGSPQDLTPILQAPIYYLSGSGDWNKDAASDYTCKRFGVADRLAWNQFSGGTWSQVEIANNDFVLVHIFATNDVNEPIIAIQGQADYGNRAAAREGATTEINSLVTTGLPSAEFTPLGTVIFQTSDSYSNAVKARVVSTDEGDNYVDFRDFTRSSTGTTNDHGNLAGLSNDDHLQYALLDGRSGGQVLIGGTDASDDLELSSTSNASKGVVFIDAGETLAVGAAAMSGSELLRVAGSQRLDTNGQLLIADSATIPPLNVTERSAEPSSPAAGDIYLDDGTNTSSGSPGWRRCVSTGPSVWEDIGAVGSVSLWTQGVSLAYLTTTTDSVVIGDTALTGTEKLKVDGGDILLEGGNINIPDNTGSSTVGVYQSNGLPILHNYGSEAVHISRGGNFTASDFDNVITIGNGALASASGVFSQIIAIGQNALNSHVNGLQNMIAIGYNAATSLTGAQTDVVIGHNAMEFGTTCIESVCIGQSAYQDGTASYNVIIGFQAANNATNMSSTVCIGHESIGGGTCTGYRNVVIGRNACDSMTTGNRSVFIGSDSGQFITSGSYNVAMGVEALCVTSNGNYNVSIGYRSMADSLASASGSLSNNVAIGSEALRYAEASSNDNTAIGYHAMSHVDNSGTVTKNVAIGYEAMDEAHGSDNCVAVGYQAGDGAGAADGCVYIGYQAGQSNSTANRLIIENSNDLSTPLIDGDFGSTPNTLRINGDLGVGRAPSYKLDVDTNINFRGGGSTGNIFANGTQVVTVRQTGWTAPTGSSTRTGFDTTTVTTQVLAEHVKALLEDLGNTSGHGLIDV